MGNEMAIKTDQLPMLQDTVSERLHHAIKMFVHNKYLLDKAVMKDGGHCLGGELYGGRLGPQEGPSFYRLVFPFAPKWGSGGERFSALVPTCQTLGCNWKQRNQRPEPEKCKEYVTFFTDPARGSITGYSPEQADYMWIRPLGLVLPNEGKNRVDFLREEQVELIPARVSEHDYPAASRIVLYRVKVHGKHECWAVLDGRWIERVNHPSWATPVLNAYGVSIDQQWPSEFPVEQDIVEGFNRPSGNPDFLNKDIVDLDRIALNRVRQQEVMLCSHLDLRAIQLRSKSFVWYWMGSFFVSLVGMSFLPHTLFIDLGILAGLVFGTAFGAGLLYRLPLFRATRATLAQEWPVEHVPVWWRSSR